MSWEIRCKLSCRVENPHAASTGALATILAAKKEGGDDDERVASSSWILAGSGSQAGSQVPA
jgi:hypothetical protein